MEESALKETETLTPINKLNVIVHPLFLNRPYHHEQSAIDRFNNDRMQMSERMMENMLPNSSSEVTYFMVRTVGGNRRKAIHAAVRNAKTSEHEYLQWTDLYRRMMHSIPYKRNLFRGGDFVSNVTAPYRDANVLIKELERRGFNITPETEIVLGGTSLCESSC